ncbi:hypothetical protein HOA91_00630, partial [Candidatus Woesearchaeota archaeon]|nr:hypothetical protein [Candidatus Woesearchaeota archaeon]
MNERKKGKQENRPKTKQSKNTILLEKHQTALILMLVSVGEEKPSDWKHHIKDIQGMSSTREDLIKNKILFSDGKKKDPTYSINENKLIEEFYCHLNKRVMNCDLHNMAGSKYGLPLRKEYKKFKKIRDSKKVISYLIFIIRSMFKFQYNHIFFQQKRKKGSKKEITLMQGWVALLASTDLAKHKLRKIAACDIYELYKPNLLKYFDNLINAFSETKSHIESLN